MYESGSNYDNHRDNHRPSKEVLEELIQKIKCPVCGHETKPYYMKFHQCQKENLWNNMTWKVLCRGDNALLVIILPVDSTLYWTRRNNICKSEREQVFCTWIQRSIAIGVSLALALIHSEEQYHIVPLIDWK